MEAASQPRPQLISWITQEWHLQPARSRAPLRSSLVGNFTQKREETSARLRHPAPGFNGVGGGPLPGTLGLSLMSPAESQLWRMPPSKTSAPRDALPSSPASSHPVTALGGPLWGTPTPTPFPLPRRAGAGAANSTNHHSQTFPSSLFPILL